MSNLKQYEIAKYLYDFASLNHLMLENTDESIENLFNFYIIDENIEDTSEYFKTMINVYVMYLKMKSFCITEEYNLKDKNNFVNDENLNLENIRSRINKDNDINLSDKKLIQELRNSFCHSDKNNELFNISNDGKIISFKDSSLKMNINDIIDLSNAIFKSTQTIQFIGFDYDKNETDLIKFLKSIDFSRYYFTKKINFDDIDSMLNLESEDKYNEFLDYASNLENFNKNNFGLTDEQINKIVLEIEKLIKNNIISIEEYENSFNEIINILILKQLPLPISKIKNYNIDSFLAHYLYTVDGFSYNDIYKILTNLLHKKEIKEFSFEKYYDSEFNNKYDNLDVKIFLSDFNQKMIYPYMIFIEYVIVNFCCDNVIIGKNNIPYNKLRNSLIHGRWIINNEKIKFYDALPDIANEMQYNFECELDFVDLYSYSINIMNNEIKKEKTYTKKA